MTEINWQPTASSEALQTRALMLKNIRAFFDARDVVEVETPLLSRFATTDPHLDSLHVHFQGQRRFLNTSPEYAMKRLLAEWKVPVYQICKAFRDDELGLNHNPEFTLLEWYRPDFDMWQLMDELAELVANLWHLSGGPSRSTKLPDKISFSRLSYQQAFEQACNINPHRVTSSQCYQVAKAGNIEIPQGLAVDDDVDEWLDWILTQQVLPNFSKNSYTFLYDYPATQCSLARVEMAKGGASVARRFELFFGEIELANGFYELTDADEQLKRFQQENVLRKKAGKEPVSIDENLLAALSYGLPVCSGVALGIDRLLMVLMGASSIDQVMSFAWARA